MLNFIGLSSGSLKWNGLFAFFRRFLPALL